MNESEDGLRRLADDAEDALVSSGLLALRREAPSERSRRELLAGLGLAAEPARAEPSASARKGARGRIQSVLVGLMLGIALGLIGAIARHYLR